ncbi:hypothetical protein Malapachy_3319 [Malassezia pachydermatis]|uniref:Uncharacterized protein n=1 Tax=Malassezia pachydermatis TaxID=77020 RepID=A0A0N0RSP0_9BASI|nr:hypothetical protein Malapachy_3319 [Malassezia pachydermatis]KOS15953.1 hypothetical protein Malapachy_3319 [Malassezia pachydermatis]
MSWPRSVVRSPGFSFQAAMASTSLTSSSDAAYQTLRRLLLAPPANRQHIELLDRNALYGSIGHYLSAMALVNVTEFAAALVTSPALWTPPSDVSQHTRDAVERANGIAQALSFAVSERMSLITKVLRRRSPRSAPKELKDWVKAVLDGVHTGMSYPGARSSLAQLAMLTGLVQGIAHERKKRTKSKARSPLSFRLRKLAAMLDPVWASALEPVLTPDKTWEAEFGAANVAVRTAALTLAAGVVDLLPETAMQAVSDTAWIDSALPLLLDIFEARGMQDTLFHDAHPRADGLLLLPKGSVSEQWCLRVQSHPLFAHAGPLSRLISAPLRRLGATMSAMDYASFLCDHPQATLPHLLVASEALNMAWTTSPLANVPADQIAEESRALTTDLWHVFKTYLFSVTLLLDAVANTVVEQCPSPAEVYPPGSTGSRSEVLQRDWPAMPTSNTPAPYLLVLAATLRIFGMLYWITSTFSMDGFESYRVVFYSALDVLSRDAEACTQLVSTMADELLQRYDDVPGGRSAKDTSFGQRIHATFFLLVVEQLASELPDTMIDHLVLPMCRPYLEDTRFQDAFESAHSVVLALYAAQAPRTKALTPFYVQLLLDCFPAQLNATQLEAALSTVVESLSDRSDSLAWWCIEQVDEALSAAQAQHKEDIAHTLGICLAALVPHVNLVLLRALLTKISARILELPAASPPRVRLVERVHESLSDMDAATRSEAMHWWLEQSSLFTEGM